MSTVPRVVVCAAVLMAAALGTGAAQGIVPVERRWGGLYAMVSPASGEFRHYAGVGGGAGVYGVACLDRDRVVGLRLQLSGTALGGPEYTIRYSSPGLPDEYQVVKYYHGVVTLSAGPQVTLPGRDVRPYLTGQIGLSYVFSIWERRWEGEDPEVEPLDSGRGHDEFNVPISAGGGLLIQLRRGARPLWLDVSAHWIGHGRSTFVSEESITQSRWGTTVRPATTRMSLWEVRVGVVRTF